MLTPTFPEGEADPQNVQTHSSSEGQANIVEAANNISNNLLGAASTPLLPSEQVFLDINQEGNHIDTSQTNEIIDSLVDSVKTEESDLNDALQQEGINVIEFDDDDQKNLVDQFSDFNKNKNSKESENINEIHDDNNNNEINKNIEINQNNPIVHNVENNSTEIDGNKVETHKEMSNINENDNSVINSAPLEDFVTGQANQLVDKIDQAQRDILDQQQQNPDQIENEIQNQNQKEKMSSTFPIDDFISSSTEKIEINGEDESFLSENNSQSNNLPDSSNEVGLNPENPNNQEVQQKDDDLTFATNPTYMDIKISTVNSTCPSPKRSSTISPRTEFRRILYGKPPPRKIYSSYQRKPHYESLVNPDTIHSTADSLLKGKPLTITDPYAVADIIDDLNTRRIDAMAANDYRTSKKIKDTIDNTRLQFRLHDRELLHKEILARLEEKNKTSIAALNSAKDKWKNETKQQHKSAKQSLIALQEQNQAEHDALEEKWVQPSTIRKFDKRSPNLLQNRQREQYMLLTGRYEEAEQMKQLNVVTEKIELEERKTEMNIHFLMARSELIQKQQSITQKKQEEIAQAENILAEKERKDLEIKNKRLLATQRTLEEEKDYNKFINKKFKRPATCIVPSTVMASRDATEDIPPIPHGAVIPHSVSDMMNIRKRSIVTPLPLQPLSIRKYKAPRLVRNSK